MADYRPRRDRLRARRARRPLVHCAILRVVLDSHRGDSDKLSTPRPYLRRERTAAGGRCRHRDQLRADRPQYGANCPIL